MIEEFIAKLLENPYETVMEIASRLYQIGNYELGKLFEELACEIEAMEEDIDI